MPFSVVEVFRVVNDVESYQDFLPNCRASNLVATSETSYDARLELAGMRMTQLLLTRNSPREYERISIEQLEGPFKSLTADWHFKDYGEGCKVSFDMACELQSSYLEVGSQPLLQRAIEKVVDAFVGEVRRRHG